MSNPSDRLPADAGPLAGLRVIDWTHVLAGPFAGYQLGLLGAEVIRIERPDGDDMIRNKAVDPDLAALGLGEVFVVQGAGKQSLAVDARDPRACAVLETLIASADVLLENFRPGKLAALGFDPARLIETYPQLIVCSITGFGPDAHQRAYDHVVQAASGLMAANASTDGTPQRVGFPIVDYAVGLQAAQAVMAALCRRERSDPAQRTRGEWLQVTMMNAALTLLAPVYASQLVSGRPTPRSASTAFSGSPLSGTFAVADGHLAIVCNAFNQVTGLFTALREAGADDGLVDALTSAAQARDVDRSQALLSELLGQATGEFWSQHLAQHGVPVATVVDTAQAARQAAVRWPRVAIVGSAGPRQVPVPGIGYTSTEPLTVALRSPPRRGENTLKLLKSAGLNEADISAMLRDGTASVPTTA